MRGLCWAFPGRGWAKERAVFEVSGEMVIWLYAGCFFVTGEQMNGLLTLDHWTLAAQSVVLELVESSPWELVRNVGS